MIFQRVAALVGFLLCWMSGQVFSAPHIHWGDMILLSSRGGTNASVSVDLRSRWESTLVSQVQLPNDVAYAPDQVWSWPSERFSASSLQGAVRLRQSERMVSRLTVFSEQLGTDFTISLQQPRLDAVHVSYRYDNGPWMTLSAGDTIAMQRWAQPDRQPSFNLPLLAGQMDLVVQVSHRGILEMPVVLQNTRAFLQERTRSIWIAGMMVGISLVMALMGMMMALNYRHAGFLSVTAMSATMVLVLVFGSGLGGMFLGTDSARFNDEIKFYVNTNWSTMMPLVAALALGLRKSSMRLGWWLAVGMAAAGWLLAAWWVQYELRDTAPAGIPVLLMVVLSAPVVLMAWAWYRDISRNWVILSALVLQLLSPILPFLAYLGWIKTDDAGQSAALLSLLAGMLLLRGLFLQYRMGRQVLARASTSPMRDVLTGLLNRAGMQAHLYKLRSRLQSEQSCAVLIYLQLINENEAMRLHGEEGFEMGLVQVAASLSTSVSGVDGLARISRNAFVVTVMMPPDPALATRMAQKILSRLMALASHGAPLAGTARMSLSWLPLYGFRLDRLEQRSLRALSMLDPVKRIGWVGGSASHAEASQLLEDLRSGQDPNFLGLIDEPDPLVQPEHEAASSNLYDRIHRIEREMLHGVDTSFLVAEAERMSRMLNEANSTTGSSTQSPEQPQDHAPTVLMDQPSIKPA